MVHDTLPLGGDNMETLPMAECELQSYAERLGDALQEEPDLEAADPPVTHIRLAIFFSPFHLSSQNWMVDIQYKS